MKKTLLTDQISTQSQIQPKYCTLCAMLPTLEVAQLFYNHTKTHKLNLISGNLRHLTQTELKLSTLMRDCTAIIYTLTTLEMDQNIQQFF